MNTRIVKNMKSKKSKANNKNNSISTNINSKKVYYKKEKSWWLNLLLWLPIIVLVIIFIISRLFRNPWSFYASVGVTLLTPFLLLYGYLVNKIVEKRENIFENIFETLLLGLIPWLLLNYIEEELFSIAFFIYGFVICIATIIEKNRNKYKNYYYLDDYHDNEEEDTDNKIIEKQQRINHEKSKTGIWIATFLPIAIILLILLLGILSGDASKDESATGWVIIFIVVAAPFITMFGLLINCIVNLIKTNNRDENYCVSKRQVSHTKEGDTDDNDSDDDEYE